MADLFDRLFPTSDLEDNIPAHYFWAAIADYVAGQTTRNQIVAAWSLDTEAQADLDALLAAVDTAIGAANKAGFASELHGIMMLAEAGLKYNTKADFSNRLNIIIDHWT